jgi:hypothetical protein
MPDLLHDLEEVALQVILRGQPPSAPRRFKPNSPLSKTPSPYYLSLQLIVFPKEELLAHANLSSRTYQALPLIRFLLQLPGQ